VTNPSLPQQSPVRASALRSAYVSNKVDTMSPGRMIVALYDRLLLDLERAEKAIIATDSMTSHECLVHAQAIVAELHDSLDREKWSAANNLGDLYLFIYTELVSANLDKDPNKVASCRSLLQPLRDAWHEAAGLI
jgi:flagellar protein FliS